MIINETKPFTAQNQVAYYSFEIFQNQPVTSLFTTRNGGVSKGCFDSLNFGFSSGDDTSSVMENYKRLATCLHCNEDQLVTAAQTHTNNIKIITREHAGMGVTRPRDFNDIDGLVTNIPGIGLITAHADCTPVQFYDPEKQVIGVAHSGWSGTLKNISGKMISILESNYQCNPKNLLVAIGPALCQDCFEVDQDVADLFLDSNPLYKEFMYTHGIKTYIDLRKIIEHQLTSTGVLSSNIECNPICTKCHEELFYSHRRMGTKRGVMASAMILNEKRTS